MKISYQARRKIRSVLIALLIIALVAVVIWGCWVLWLGRYVVYTRDEGAVIDRNLGPIATGAHMEAPSNETISIYYNEGENSINTSTDLTQLNGFYIDAAALQKDAAGVKAQIQALPDDVPIMIAVKNIFGSFFYDSAVSATRSDSVSAETVGELIKFLNDSNRYVIAMAPALRDRDRGLNHTNDGLPDQAFNGGALWADEEGCYWLNPASQGTVSYLIQIATELRSMGFDEVVFTEYWIPDDERIMFSGDRAETLASTAQTLVTSCATEKFAVSFGGDGTWKLPEGRTRLYMQNVDAAEAAKRAESVALPDPAINLVFMTDLYDTRFDTYSVMRPLAAAH